MPAKAGPSLGQRSTSCGRRHTLATIKSQRRPASPRQPQILQPDPSLQNRARVTPSHVGRHATRAAEIKPCRPPRLTSNPPRRTAAMHARAHGGRPPRPRSATCQNIADADPSHERPPPRVGTRRRRHLRAGYAGKGRTISETVQHLLWAPADASDHQVSETASVAATAADYATGPVAAKPCARYSQPRRPARDEAG